MKSSILVSVNVICQFCLNLDIFRGMANLGSESEALDLSFKPLDLCVKRPISISEQINGVAHFSFALDKLDTDATQREDINSVDVEVWDDSLWNVKSVIQLAEIVDDWKSEESNSEDESGPWRCKIVVEDKKKDLGYDITRESTGDSDLDNLYCVENAIGDTSEFFVFSNPTHPAEAQHDMTGFTVTNSYVSDVSVAAESETLLVPSATDVAFVEEYCPAAVVRKRGFDQSLLDCWSNDDLEYANSAKRWRFDHGDELDEVLSDEIGPCDEIMVEVSDCEEGSDIVELPVVEDHVDYLDSVSFVEDCRSILYDSDLQIFPSEESIAESRPPIPMSDTSNFVVAINNEDSVKSDSLLVPETNHKLKMGEVLETKSKVEPNNNSDDFLSNLLVDLP